MNTDQNVKPNAFDNAITPEIRRFLENLLVEANITPVDDLMEEQLIQELYVRLDNFMAKAIFENMPPEHIEEFIKMNEENWPKEKINQFISEKIPSSQDVFAKTLILFHDIYLGEAGVSASTNLSN